jgi:N-acetylglucosaminyldiphosphoundecaprenol N-acetyl-beta-D-mannosaminyltransferase
MTGGASEHMKGAQVTGAGAMVEGPLVRIDDVLVHAFTHDQVVQSVTSELAAGRGGHLVTPNVDIVRQLRDPALRRIVTSARIVVADGAPLVWASRLQGTPLPERVPGSQLIWSLTAAAENHDLRVFLLGGGPGVAIRAADVLQDRFAGLSPVLTHCPPFGFEHSPAEMRTIREALLAAAPDLVFVGLGFPKQDLLVCQLREIMPHTWFVGCGGAIAFVAGTTHRAPDWIQRCGLEWLHRLSREPRRLARRYLVDDAPFALRLLLNAAFRGLTSRMPIKGSRDG